MCIHQQAQRWSDAIAFDHHYLCSRKNLMYQQRCGFSLNRRCVIQRMWHPYDRYCHHRIQSSQTNPGLHSHVKPPAEFRHSCVAVSHVLVPPVHSSTSLQAEPSSLRRNPSLHLQRHHHRSRQYLHMDRFPYHCR